MSLSTPKILDIIIGDAQIGALIKGVTGATGYILQASRGSRFATVDGQIAITPGTAAYITGLLNGQRYKIRVYATKAGEPNSFAFKSVGWYVPSGAVLPQLATPSLTATAISSSEIDLSSTVISGATSYKFERATDAGFTTGLTVLQNSSATTFNNTSLPAATAYHYRVTAIGSGYANSNPGTATATTLAGAGSPVGYFLQKTDDTNPTEGEIEAGTSFPITAGQDYTVTIPNIGLRNIMVFEPATEPLKTLVNDTLGDAAINSENAFANIITVGAYRGYKVNYQTAFDTPQTFKVD